MPLLIAALGIVLLVAAVRGSTSTLFELVHNDLTGPNNFLIWLGAILGLGLFGYIKPIRPIAAGFLTLVVLALVLSNKGFFSNFAAAFQSTVNTPQQNITTGQDGASNATQQPGMLSGLQPFQDFQLPADFGGGNTTKPADLVNGLQSIFGGSGGGSTASQAADVVLSLF